MRSFKDNEGREWLVDVTVDTVKRVRAALDVDLLEAAGGKLVERLVADPILLADLLYVICRPQVQERNLTDEDFGRALAGQAIDHATQALLEGLVDFFPSRKSAVLRRALEKLEHYETIAADHAMQMLESPELEAQIKQLLAEAGPSFTSVPASSGSTPAP